MKKNVGLVIAWIAIYGLFAVAKPASFLTLSNIELMFRQSIVEGIGAIGMTFVIIMAGIDLSAGSAIAATMVISAITLKSTENPILAIAVGLAAGVVIGLTNGLAITKLKLSPFISTLATMLAIRGFATGLANESTISGVPRTWLRVFTEALPPERAFLLIPLGAWVWILLAVMFGWILRNTVFGRNTIAIGSNEKTAILCGIRVDRTKLAVYALAGGLFGLAGVMQLSRTMIGDPTIAQGAELNMIAAVVIGGASLSGGQGSIFGAVIGTLMMTTISMGCNQMGIPNWIQQMLTGLIILTAVVVDRYRHRSRPV